MLSFFEIELKSAVIRTRRVLEKRAVYPFGSFYLNGAQLVARLVMNKIVFEIGSVCDIVGIYSVKRSRTCLFR